jgi:outer membrane protein assembly factor BamD (BamD/ComL family)
MDFDILTAGSPEQAALAPFGNVPPLIHLWENTLMKHLLALFGAVALLISGCSKSTPDEYFARAEGEEAAAVLIADTLTNLEERQEVFADAIGTYTELMEEYPSTEHAETALFKLATIYNNHTREFRKAVDMFDRYIALYPSGENAAVSQFMVGYIYNNELAMLDSAKVAYERFLAQHPDHEMAPSAQFELKNLGRSPEELIPGGDAGEDHVARGGDKD